MPPKRKADNNNASDGDERSAKRFKADVADAVAQVDTSPLHALSKDALLSVAIHLDAFAIVALFSTSKRWSKQLSTEQIWRELCLQRLGTVGASNAKTMSWRTLCLHLNKTKQPLEYVEQLLAHIKSSSDLSDQQRLQILSNAIAHQEFQQTLVDQAEEFLKTHPALLPLWRDRVVYLHYEVLADVEWSMENYKWDVTSTAPVKLVVVGTNGKVLQLTSLSSYFACAWAYNHVTYFKAEVTPIEDVFSARPLTMGGYSSEDERVPDEDEEGDEGDENDDDDDDDDEGGEKKDRDQHKWFRERPISSILVPFTPQEDDNDQSLIQRLEQRGWHDIDECPVELFAALLQQIGLADVAASDFKSLFVRATFPDRERVRYYTHLRGYYAPRVPQSHRFELSGAGGLSNWGSIKIE